MENKKTLAKTFTLNNGVKMPAMGFGTYLINRNDELVQPIVEAINAGYKMLDLAVYYKIHTSVVAAIKQTNVRREDLFLVSKVWTPGMAMATTYEDTKVQLQEIIDELETDYIDLVLIHWPANNSVVAWKAFEEFYEAGKAKAIGVSNFTPSQLEGFCQKVKIKPMVNQFQMSPTMNRTALLAKCKELDVLATSWRSLGGIDILNHPVIVKIAKQHAISPAAVCLLWVMQQEVVIIPKSVHKDRIISNSQLDNLSLTPEEMVTITNMKPQDIYWPIATITKREPSW